MHGRLSEFPPTAEDRLRQARVNFPRTYFPGRSILAGNIVFKRRVDGAVEFRDDKHRLIGIVSANIWASIVSSVSCDGETAMTYNMALTLHTNGVAHDPNAADHHTEIPPQLEL